TYTAGLILFHFTIRESDLHNLQIFTAAVTFLTGIFNFGMLDFVLAHQLFNLFHIRLPLKSYFFSSSSFIVIINIYLLFYFFFILFSRINFFICSISALL